MRAVVGLSVFMAFASAQDLNRDAIFAVASGAPVTAITTSIPISVTTERTAATLSKRHANITTTCAPLPTGIDVHPSPDTAAAFSVYPYFSSVALAAPVPTGFTQVYSNMDASSYDLGYLGADFMDTYDTQQCSDQCQNILDCVSFNIYFERNPSVVPNNVSCPDPSSTTRIVCAYYSGPIDEATAINPGIWREEFQVVRVGSNGYVDSRIMATPGYDEPQGLGNATIAAPLDCSSSDTYMGMLLFHNTPYEAQRCATHCTNTSNWNANHGFWQTCQFFTTFLLFKNEEIVGQYCAMYTKEWNRSYATNTGYWAGNDHYTVGYSFSYANATNAGTSRYACNTRRQLSV